MPKHFPNNSKETSKKSRKRLFRPPKWPNHGCQSGKKCRFLSPFSIYELYFWLVGSKKKLKSFPLIAKDIKKKRKKNLIFFPKKNGKVNTPSIHLIKRPKKGLRKGCKILKSIVQGNESTLPNGTIRTPRVVP